MATVPETPDVVYESHPVIFEHQMPHKVVPHDGKLDLYLGAAGLTLRWQRMTADESNLLKQICPLKEISRYSLKDKRITFFSDRRGVLGPFVFKTREEIKRLLQTVHRRGLSLKPQDQQGRAVGQQLISLFANFGNALLKASATPDDLVNYATYRPDLDDDDDDNDDEVAAQATKDVYCRRNEDGFEILDAEELPEPPPCERTEALNATVLQSFMKEDGSGAREDAALREAIFRGGLTMDARAIGWRYLLDQPVQMSADMRAEREELYLRIKTQWESMTAKQVANNYRMRDAIQSIRKDVPRSDRFIGMYRNEDGPGLKALNDILMTYVMYNFDLGYVQGMNDLAAGLFYVFGSASEAFLAFARLMEQQESTFALEQKGMLDRLELLKTILRYVDPELMRFLQTNESGHLLFCFRWLLVTFKREFQYEQVLRVWEVIWSQHLSPNFELFVAAALLHHHREQFLRLETAADILQQVNRLTSDYTAEDVETILLEAERLYWRLRQSEHTPAELEDILQTWTERHPENRTAVEQQMHGAM
eukprot:TRINITY_DN11848_c0_g1_i4.p1 TRINITY_DN11848_c0_g1~~TRINITY_DN11848_c0_g1_i4.p1  ORF type:complete len:558 (+),score=133.44 TRINITY_DN11848_c0_g1_i4:66-1676(+)